MSSYSDRGMIKWMPYQSLNEQATYLHQMRANRSKVAKPLISSDRASAINEILVQYHGEIIYTKYFSNGRILEEIGIIKYIDNFAKRLRINDIDIDFINLLDLQER